MATQLKEKAAEYAAKIKAPPKGMALLVPKHEYVETTKSGLKLYIPEVTFVLDAHAEIKDRPITAYVIHDEHYNLPTGTQLLIASNTAGAILDDTDGLGIDKDLEIWTLPFKMHDAPKGMRGRRFDQVLGVIE
jgi:hypothetical protein